MQQPGRAIGKAEASLHRADGLIEAQIPPLHGRQPGIDTIDIARVELAAGHQLGNRIKRFVGGGTAREKLLDELGRVQRIIRAQPLERRRARSRPMARGHERQPSALSEEGFLAAFDARLRQAYGKYGVLCGDARLSRLHGRADLPPRPARQVGGDAERGQSLPCVQFQEARARRCRPEQPRRRRRVPPGCVMLWIEHAADPRCHLETHDERLQHGIERAVLLLGQRQNGRYRDGAYMRDRGRPGIVVVQHVGAGAADERGNRRRITVRRSQRADIPVPKYFAQRVNAVTEASRRPAMAQPSRSTTAHLARAKVPRPIGCARRAIQSASASPIRRSCPGAVSCMSKMFAYSGCRLILRARSRYFSVSLAMNWASCCGELPNGTMYSRFQLSSSAGACSDSTEAR